MPRPRQNPGAQGTVTIPFAEMTEPQKMEAYQKWLVSQQTRKVKSAAKRKAVTLLKKNHQAEYDQLVKGLEAGLIKALADGTATDQDLEGSEESDD